MKARNAQLKFSGLKLQLPKKKVQHIGNNARRLWVKKNVVVEKEGMIGRLQHFLPMKGLIFVSI